MKKYDVASSLAWMVVGLLFCKGSISLGVGRFNEPGPGFFPFVMSVSLMFFCSMNVVYSLLRKYEKIDLLIKVWPKKDGIRRIFFTILFLCGYVVALEHAGFLLTTFLFMFVTLKFVEPQKWVTVFLGAGVTAAMSYLAFQVWLRSNLPGGTWGFW
jgi:putative tricarboxylic transport membrane protein